MGLVAMVGWLFREALLGDAVYFKRDVHLVWHAQIEVFVTSVLSGAWPVWNPSLGFGRPLLADPSAQILYPLTWLNLLMKPWKYYTLFAVFHALLSSVGLFVLGRRFELSAAGAFVSAGLWLLAGPVLSSVDLWHHYAGLAWLPWVVLAADRALETKTWGRALGWGAVQGLQMLAGSADACTMTAIAVLALGFRRHVVWERRARGPNLKLLGTSGLAALTAMGLAAGLWIPALDQVSRAARSDLPSEVRTYWSVHPLGMLDTLIPGLWSSLPLNATLRQALFESREPFLASLYLGAGALGLVAAALVGSKHPLKGVLAALGVGSLLIALGSHAPFYGIAATLFPPLRILRYPVKMMALAAFAWSLLGGLGLDHWRQGTPSTEARWRQIAAIVAIFAAAALGGAVMAAGGAEFWSSLLLQLPPGVTPREGLAATAARFGVVAALGGTLALLAWRRSHPRGRFLAGAAGMLALVDLGVYHRHPNPTAPESLFLHRPAVLKLLSTPDPRVYVYDYSVPGKAREYLARESPYEIARQPVGWSLGAASALAMQMYLAPESGGRFGLRGSYEIDYRGLYPRDLELLTRLLRHVEGTDLHHRLLALGNVTDVVTLHAQGFSDLEVVGQVPGLFRDPIQIFRVPHPLPRTYVVGRAIRANGLEGLAALTAPGFEPRNEIVLSDGGAGSATSPFVGTSRILGSSPDRVTLEADLNAPGYVVLLDGYDPGWLAKVDGKPAPVLGANIAFRAVAVPPGHHVIEQLYRPRPVVLGLTLSLATALALLGAAVGFRPGSRGARPDEPGGSSA